MKYFVGTLFLTLLGALTLSIGPSKQNAAYAQDFLDSLEAEIIQDQAEEQAAQQTQSSSASAETPEAPDTPDIPEPYIYEADLFYQHCEAKSVMHAHYDCECLAAHFLDQRIAMGAQSSRISIMKKIDKECIDASEEAFNQYNKCKANTLLLPKNIPADTYCTCYGNEYAKGFESGKYTIDPSTVLKMQTRAHTKCAKGTYAVDNYAPPPS